MAEMIIVEHFSGRISVHNSAVGAVFSITVPSATCPIISA